jgi:hypothetical protein
MLSVRREVDRAVIKEDMVPLDPERPVGSEHLLKTDIHIAPTGVPVHLGDQEIVHGPGHREILINSVRAGTGSHPVRCGELSQLMGLPAADAPHSSMHHLRLASKSK